MSHQRPDYSHPQWETLRENPHPNWQTLSSVELVGGERRVLQDKIQVGEHEISYQYRPRGARAVFILPVTTEGELVLIRQYRYPLRTTITELVAGGVETGENLYQAAQRELCEEVGGVASRWQALPTFYPQPSISGVIFYPYIAWDVCLGNMAHEPSETIERLILPPKQVFEMLEAGEIHDASSSLILWRARALLGNEGK